MFDRSRVAVDIPAKQHNLREFGNRSDFAGDWKLWTLLNVGKHLRDRCLFTRDENIKRVCV